MRRLTALLLAIVFVGMPTSGQAPPREIDNVAAFARLFGVVRYFYPSDAAAALDWNRFAVHGVSQVRLAADATTLETTLKALVAPLGRGIVIARQLPPAPTAGSPDGSLIAWRYLGAGITAGGSRSAYKAKRTQRPLLLNQSMEGFTTVMQTVPALLLRGKTIRLRGLVRAEPSAGDSSGSAALWLRVDRAGQQMGFFDNMGNRPIRTSDWRQYEIEGPVVDDATNVAFGVMASGAITAEFESIGLSVRDAAGAWTPIEIKDPGFEDPSGTAGWGRAGTSKTALLTRPTDKAPEGRQFLRIAPAPATVSNAEIFAAPAPAAGAHADVALGSGLYARVPLALSEAQAAGDPADTSRLEALRLAVATVKTPIDQPNVDVRLADVVVAWNVFRHFYPYWKEVMVDWNERLKPQLAAAHGATTRAAHHDAMRLLVADLRDGHGGVYDQATGVLAVLPVQLQMVDGRVAITASAAPDAPVGAVVVSIDGVAADRRLADAARLASGTPQWKERRALQEIITCPAGGSATMVVDSGAGPRSITLPCAVKQPAVEKRPTPVGELQPGIWYVDLTRASMAQITPELPRLARAVGVVFDVRGYPSDAGFQILPHLIASAETDRWMHVDRIVGPFGASAGTDDTGWDIKPAQPRLTGRIVFLTDGRAISYAESVMGYVADKKLGTIVGGTTAGANGNVQPFVVPSGYRITFTGMRVTGHDGSAAHHLVGIKPDIPMAPTLVGLRAGRDELLERAIGVIRGQ